MTQVVLLHARNIMSSSYGVCIRYYVFLQKAICLLIFTALLLLLYYGRQMLEEKRCYHVSSKNLADEDVIDFSHSDNITGFSNYIVPNIVHFIHFGSNQLSFIEVVTVRAAHLHQHPEKIMIHCNCSTMSGKYWDMVKDIPVLEVKYMAQPTEIFGKNLTWIQHSSDVARIMVLMEYGGIYLDSDTYVVKSLDEYRKFEMTLCWEPGQYMATPVLIAHSNARFLKLWYNSYRYYRGDLWYFNAGELPTMMYLHPMPHLVHRVQHSFGGLYRGVVHLLYEVRSDEWKNFQSIHMLVRHRSYILKKNPVIDFNEENIKAYNKSFGEMARLVIYGTTDLITERSVSS